MRARRKDEEGMGADDKEGRCCRLGKARERSAASSALLLDKQRQTVT